MFMKEHGIGGNQKPRKPLKRSALKRKPRKKQPGDDPKYLEWIRTLPCWVCSSTPDIARLAHPELRRVEAHHAGDHGFAQKAPDRTAIPLCAYHHRLSMYSAHLLGKNFWKHHNLDRDQIIKELNERYDQLNA